MSEHNRDRNCLTLAQMDLLCQHGQESDSFKHLRAHLKHCTLCAEAFEGFKKIHADSGQDRIFDTINHTVRTKIKQLHPNSRKLYRVLAAAAVLLLVLLPTISSILNRVNNERLFQRFFTMCPIQTVELDGTIQAALVSYQRQDYSKTAKLLYNLLQTDPDNRVAHFYLGVIRLGEDESRQAIYHLSMATLDKRFFSIANWYLGLAHVRNDSKGIAIDKFRSVKGEYETESSTITHELTAQKLILKAPSVWFR